MPVPAPSDYLPWDDQAPRIFYLGQVDSYIAGSFVMLVLYDHLITLDREISMIWTLRWRLPKFLFLVNRYIVPPMILMNSIVERTYPLLESFCAFMVRWEPWTVVIAITTVELILIVRVSALYERNRGVFIFLVSLFTFEMISVAVNTTFVIKETFAVLNYEFLPSCSNSGPADTYSFWIPFAIFEGIMMILTLYKLFRHRNDINPTMRLLARDSSIYFVVMFASLLVNLLMFRYSTTLPDVAVVPSSCIACIAVSRMMMNIRSLATADPRALDSIQLGTVKFQNPSSLGVETDIEMSGYHTPDPLRNSEISVV